MAALSDANLTIEAEVIKNETADGANTADRVGQMLEDLIDSKVNGAVYPIKTYATLISQSGTNDPSVGTEYSSFSGALTFARAGSTGLFTITSANSEFVSGKTLVFFGNGTTGGQNPVGSYLSSSVIAFVGRNAAGTTSDSQINTCSVKIEVYP